MSISTESLCRMQVILSILELEGHDKTHVLGFRFNDGVDFIGAHSSGAILLRFFLGRVTVFFLGAHSSRAKSVTI